MKNKTNYVALVLKQPDVILSFDLEKYSLLVRQARQANLLATIGEKLSELKILNQVPVDVRHHFEASMLHAKRHKPGINVEVRNLKKVLSQLGLDLLLLKGAAYVYADLPAAKGRFFNDLDILVPKDRIDQLELALRDEGWVSGKTDAYDNKYYREWMHEIPPLRHFMRKTELDVHHTILPPTSKYHPDVEKLFESAIEISSGVKMLCPEDMLIHSATHLFHDGELEHGLRDIVDLNQLMNHFGEGTAQFWERLVPRAKELDLIRPLYYGLRYTQKILGTSIPEKVIDEVSYEQPSAIMRPVMDFLFLRALAPDHASCDRFLTKTARYFLYIRSHYLRMPLRLLLPHLIRKAWKKRFEKDNVPIVLGKQL